MIFTFTFNRSECSHILFSLLAVWSAIAVIVFAVKYDDGKNVEGRYLNKEVIVCEDLN